MFGRPRRLALLAEASFNATDAKSAVGVLRYRPREVAAVIDATRAGRTAQSCAGVGGDVPVVASVEAAAARGADSLLIGVAPQGGELPAAWRAAVADALARGWDVFSGLHAFLADDPEFAAAAARTGAVIHDVRRPPAERRVAAGRALAVDATVVLTVGSDCNVGKMTAALELVRALEAHAARAAFVATGQTGIFIADRGVAVDAVPADFVAGAVERLVVEAATEAEFVVVEGQGALAHPGYSGVTLALLHGACPAAIVLCHQATRETLRVGDGMREHWPIAPLPGLVRAYEDAAGWVRPARVVAVALNTLGMDEPAARAACAAAARATGLPCTDPVRFGAATLAEAVMMARSSRATHA
jgi:D-glutamate N-acetyltransferase